MIKTVLKDIGYTIKASLLVMAGVHLAIIKCLVDCMLDGVMEALQTIPNTFPSQLDRRA